MADRYLLLGEGVGNSPSPMMMNAAFDAMGIDAKYGAVSVSPSGLEDAFREIRDEGVRGLNITIPHKASITRLLDSLDEVSTSVGAANTVNKEGGMYRGYNTDVEGIVVPLTARRLSPFRRAVALGTGGAARAFCAAMYQTGSTSLTFLSRDPSKAQGFLENMAAAFPAMDLQVVSYGDARSQRPDIIFNASPVGSGGRPLPTEVKPLLGSRPVVFDAIYSPVETELIRSASARGCPVIHGYEMLLAQAIGALKIWTGRPCPAEPMREALLASLGAAT
ncbi:MAG: shikimate dehydrogenase [Nitrososphaerota archaeon]|jgi:shikimate dehydrogenase|nr:shikimate dehydrogenase [Nitrososphaerota archaeon]MDG6943195.1 shikimate dehydrogenase [Nitrososphaerota archaeon]MDG6950927.1 shikimate dehydrogenase [Nitrososphaerota archaeon]